MPGFLCVSVESMREGGGKEGKEVGGRVDEEVGGRVGKAVGKESGQWKRKYFDKSSQYEK